MFGTVNSLRTILINSGSFKKRLLNESISGDNVAENIIVWWFSGTFTNMVSISSRNPMSSISSASSSIIIFTVSIFNVRRRIWSITRPGVPMMT